MEKTLPELAGSHAQNQVYAPQAFPTAAQVHRKPVPVMTKTAPLSRVTSTSSSASETTGTGYNVEKPEHVLINGHITDTKADFIGVSRSPPLPPPPKEYNGAHTHTNSHSHHYENMYPDQKQMQTKQDLTNQYSGPACPSNSYPLSKRRQRHTRTKSSLPPIFTDLKRRYLSLRKRTRYLLLGALVLLVILIIIGLAVGLSRRSRFSNLPLPSNHGGPYSGDLTYYDPGLGACGVTSSGKDFIVAVSHLVFDAVQVGSNPNANPLCGKKVRASRGGKSVDLTVVDRCTGCKPQDLDVTRTVFEGLASIDQGRVPVTWAWLEDIPGAATSS